MIGWKEWCALPALGLPGVQAKIDTGARTSALHASDIEIIKKTSGSVVRFKIHPHNKDGTRTRLCESPLLARRTIISSNGEREIRPVILTDIRIGSLLIRTELTLTARHKMNFPMLLGRKALRAGRFTVDPVKSYLLGNHPDHS